MGLHDDLINVYPIGMLADLTAAFAVTQGYLEEVVVWDGDYIPDVD